MFERQNNLKEIGTTVSLFVFKLSGEQTIKVSLTYSIVQKNSLSLILCW